MRSIFYCVAKRPTEEFLCLQTESGIEYDLTDFYSCSLEKGDLVLHGQGPEEGQILGELDNLLYHESVDVREMHEQRQFRHQGWQVLVMDEQMSWRPELHKLIKHSAHMAGMGPQEYLD